MLSFTVDELLLIRRCISDSMNYKPNTDFQRKWALLLRIAKEMEAS